MLVSPWPDDRAETDDLPSPGFAARPPLVTDAARAKAVAGNERAVAGTERPLGFLAKFADLLGPEHAHLTLAVLHELAVWPCVRWTLREAADHLAWLAPASATRILAELRAAGLVKADLGVESYWVSDEGRVLAAVSVALGPGVDARRLVRVIAAAMTLARAADAPEDALFAPLESATAVLEADVERLLALISSRQDDQLLAAAELARTHAADMAALFEAHVEVLSRPRSDPRFAATQRRAAMLVGQVASLAGEIVAALTGQMDDFMRGSLESERRDLRQLVASMDLDALADLVTYARLPSAVPPADPAAAFAALDEYLSRNVLLPVALPEPVIPAIEHPGGEHPEAEHPGGERPATAPDPVAAAAEALTLLAQQEGARLADWVVGGSWAEASARIGAVVEAWTRFGPAGDGSLAVELDPLPALDVVGQHEVDAISRTLLRPVHPEAGP